MSAQQRFSLLRKILKALGLSDDRIEELMARIQEWLLDDQAEKEDAPQYPYQLRDDFLSPAELNFYRVLQTAVSDWAVILTKINLADRSPIGSHFHPLRSPWPGNSLPNNAVLSI